MIALNSCKIYYILLICPYHVGSEKDKDGFYFKGNTSVPSYHGTEELQQPSESWDDQGIDFTTSFNKLIYTLNL